MSTARSQRAARSGRAACAASSPRRRCACRPQARAGRNVAGPTCRRRRARRTSRPRPPAAHACSIATSVVGHTHACLAIPGQRRVQAADRRASSIWDLGAALRPIATWCRRELETRRARGPRWRPRTRVAREAERSLGNVDGRLVVVTAALGAARSLAPWREVERHGRARRHQNSVVRETRRRCRIAAVGEAAREHDVARKRVEAHGRDLRSATAPIESTRHDEREAAPNATATRSRAREERRRRGRERGDQRRVIELNDEDRDATAARPAASCRLPSSTSPVSSAHVAAPTSGLASVTAVGATRSEGSTSTTSSAAPVAVVPRRRAHVGRGSLPGAR